MHNFCKKTELSKASATKAELSPGKLSFIWSGGQGTISSLALKGLCTGNEGSFNSFRKMSDAFFSHIFCKINKEICGN